MKLVVRIENDRGERIGSSTVTLSDDCDEIVLSEAKSTSRFARGQIGIVRVDCEYVTLDSVLGRGRHEGDSGCDLGRA